MHELLTEKFLSMKWDENYLERLSTSISEDAVVSSLDSIFPEWSFQITHMISVNNEMRIGGTLFLPGRLIDGTGSNETDAIYNIISALVRNVKHNSNVEQKSFENPQLQELKPITTSDVVEKLAAMKSNVAPNSTPVEEPKASNTQEIFDALLGMPGTKETSVEENNDRIDLSKDIEVPFDSKEAREYDAEFWKIIDGNIPVLEQPTREVQDINAEALRRPNPEEVNPTGRLVPREEWDVANGTILKTWMTQHNVTKIEEINAWLKQYCGLDYDHFDPKWTQKFINWTEALKERQTY